jgi:hypothetical protein
VATLAKGKPADGRGSTFKKDVTLLVLDKVVFGLLIVVAAFLLNRILDQHRAKITFEAEFAKERAGRVAGLLSLEARRDNIILRLTAAELGAVDYLRQQDEALNARRQKDLEVASRGLAQSVVLINNAQDVLGRLPKIQPVLDANRFWLGRTLYQRIAQHVALEQRVEKRVPVIITSADPHKLKADIDAIQQLREEAENPIDIDEVTRILSAGG